MNYAVTKNGPGRKEKMPTSGNAIQKPVPAKTEYSPRSFGLHHFETLKTLCETIVPKDRESGGAIEAGVPELIDWIAGQNKDYQRQLVVGLNWLDAACTARHGQPYLFCTPAQRKELLDLIAYRKNVELDPRLIVGIEFFSILRKDTVAAFFASEVGLKYLGWNYSTRIM